MTRPAASISEPPIGRALAARFDSNTAHRSPCSMLRSRESAKSVHRRVLPLWIVVCSAELNATTPSVGKFRNPLTCWIGQPTGCAKDRAPTEEVGDDLRFGPARRGVGRNGCSWLSSTNSFVRMDADTTR